MPETNSNRAIEATSQATSPPTSTAEPAPVISSQPAASTQPLNTTGGTGAATAGIESTVDAAALSSSPAAGEPVAGMAATATPDPGFLAGVEPLGSWIDALQGAISPVAAPLLASLNETFGSGGPVLLVLFLLSIAALAIVLVKLWQFAQLRINAREPVARALVLWRSGDAEPALARLARSKQPAAKLVHLALIGLDRPGNQQEKLREELTRFATLQLQALRSWLRALEVIAAISPLLGLLGTVLGMIEAFRQLEAAGSQVDPAILSGGIWQALLTTAAGLTVAIPVVLVHAWLERRVERCAHRMEDAVTRVFTGDLDFSDRAARARNREDVPAQTPRPQPKVIEHAA